MLIHPASPKVDSTESSTCSGKSFSDSIDQPINLPLTLLEQRCLEETTRYFKDQSTDGRYCFELFRRAMVEKKEAAWELLYDHYRPQIVRRLKKNNRLARLNEDPEVLVNEVFAKFERAVSPEKFATFDGLKSVVRYLNLCADSVVIDHLRKHSQSEEEISPDIAVNSESPQSNVERDEFLALIMSRLKNDQEHLVFRAMFILGMKPQEICDEWSHSLPTVQRVNQIRQNIVDRLKRDEALRRYYEGV